ncbi:AAA family ATPase [Sphingobacterium oryzagri]|uniref:AAA family ATPase n=1 Tax=Sphingobacterium oryzagri TaxID=3025669 RepID=A0ABY7WM18_9SPHI|nr:AAA family ATPase [Sphingobacterium sp. KACC 22765]WDF69609.1 AAA family ATPase [Sphingobacterium sp. KACC 22765]
MSISTIIDKSKELFTQFEPINDTLYKGNYQINDKLAGIYFLNFSERISEEDFEELQYKYLAEEFYKNEDSLQWNIYLLFINSTFNDGLKSKILSNDKYARKLIFKEDEFLDYFELEDSDRTSLPNIVSEWKNELKSVDLQEVYSEATYVEAVDNFLKNSSVKEVSDGVTGSLISTITVDKISSINLKENYRHFPLVRNFNFGTVNLINGVNGSGKTSLLESIELILTGKSNRNSDKDEETGSISAVLNNNIEEVYTPNVTGKYKSRDVKWYSRNHLVRGNNCYQSFNQFNFFNTDAAYQFASSDHEDQINESLKQIVLGAEYTFLRDRIRGFEGRLRPELNIVERELKEQKELIESHTQLIHVLKADSNFEDIKKNIAGNVLALQYKNTFSADDYSISNLYINEIKTEIEYILNQNLVFDLNSLDKLKSEIDEQVDTVNSLINEYNERNAQRIDLFKQHKSLRVKRDKIKSILKYFVIEDYGNIEDSEEQLQKHNLKLSKLEKIKNEFSMLELDSFLNENKRFKDLQNSRNEDFQKVSSDRKEIENEIKILSDNFSAVDDILNKIKLLGKDFLSHHEHSQSCPLCEQQISHSELFAKLDNDFKNNVDKSILEERSKKLAGLKTKEVNLFFELNTLNGLEFIVQQEVPDYERLTVNEIVSHLNFILNGEALVLQEKIRIETTLAQVTAIGGSVSEFKSLREEIVTYLNSDNSFEKRDIDKILLRLEDDIKEIVDDVEKLSQENDLLISNLSKSLQLKEAVDNISEILAGIKSQSVKVKALERSFIKVKVYLDLQDDQSITDLSKALYILEENIKSLRDSENRQQELQ